MTKKELEDKLVEYVEDNQKQYELIKVKNDYIRTLEMRIKDLELQLDRARFENKVKDELMRQENEKRGENNER